MNIGTKLVVEEAGPSRAPMRYGETRGTWVSLCGAYRRSLMKLARRGPTPSEVAEEIRRAKNKKQAAESEALDQWQADLA